MLQRNFLKYPLLQMKPLTICKKTVLIKRNEKEVKK